jgi:parvulin-like peptidyl-prolyl isomerase
MTPNQVISRTFASWVLWLVGAGLVGAQTPAGAPPKAETYPSPVSANIPAAADKPAVLVNGEMISMADVKAMIESRPYPTTLKADEIKGYRQATLDILIDNELLRQFFAKHAPKVAPADVAKEIRGLEEQLKKQNQTLAEFLKNAGESLEQLQKYVTVKLQWRGYLQSRMSDEQAKKYYEENKLFFDDVRVRASHILVKVPRNASPEQKQTLLSKAETIRQEIVSGKITFEAAAKQYSECNSKTKSGDVGFFRYKFDMLEPFAHAAFSLKPGDVSGIVATEVGYHLIKVTDRTQPKELSTFETVRDSMREIWAMDVELYQQIITHQRKTAKIEVFLQ